MISRLLRIALPAVLACGVGLPSAAAVVTEAGAQFSRHWKSPTEVGWGADTILGTAEKQNAHEFIVLTALGAGSQTLTFDFAAPDWALSSDSFSGGGQVFWGTQPFRHAWDGTSLGTFQLSRWTPTQQLQLSLDDRLSGPLYLGVYFTHGRDVAWRLSAPGNAPSLASAEAVTAVPLPASGWLVLAGAVALGFAGRRNSGKRVSSRLA